MRGSPLHFTIPVLGVGSGEGVTCARVMWRDPCVEALILFPGPSYLPAEVARTAIADSGLLALVVEKLRTKGPREARRLAVTLLGVMKDTHAHRLVPYAPVLTQLPQLLPDEKLTTLAEQYNLCVGY